MKINLFKIIFNLTAFICAVNTATCQCVFLANGYDYKDYFVSTTLHDAWKEISEGEIIKKQIDDLTILIASGCYIKPAPYSYTRNTANCIQSQVDEEFRPTENGPYMVKVDIKYESCYISRLSQNTIFPDSWDYDKIKCEIIGVLYNPNVTLVSNQNGRFIYSALASNNQFQIEIETTDRITPQNLLKDPVTGLVKCQVYTAYPVIE